MVDDGLCRGYGRGDYSLVTSGPFVDWFYDKYTADSSAIDDFARQVYVRDFQGAEGIAGWFGVYRDMLTTAEPNYASG